jgi:hypothetical protein
MQEYENQDKNTIFLIFEEHFWETNNQISIEEKKEKFEHFYIRYYSKSIKTEDILRSIKNYKWIFRST